MTEWMDGQLGLFDPDSWSGKMSPEPSAADPRREPTSPPSLRKSSKSANREPICLCVYQTEDGQKPGAYTLKMVRGALLGEYMMPSFGEQPNFLMAECSFPALPSGVSVSRLSATLEDSPHPKYSLSDKACEGILKRAETRGKELPAELRAAVEAQLKRYLGDPAQEDRPPGQGLATVPIEGNGQRGSNRGDGYGGVGDPMFTLNSVERHGVATVRSGGFHFGQSAMAHTLGWQNEASPTVGGGNGGNSKPCVAATGLREHEE